MIMVTLRADDADLPMRWTSDHAAKVFTHAADFWLAKADIQFANKDIANSTDEMPANTVQDKGRTVNPRRRKSQGQVTRISRTRSPRHAHLSSFVQCSQRQP
jgi:hypothetical protein